MSSSNPLLHNAQWRRIEKLLPPNRQDRVAIAAILYLEFCGESMRHACELFGLSRTRLHEWHQALEVDGSLAKVQAALKLEPSGRRAGGFSTEAVRRNGRRDCRDQGSEISERHCAAGGGEPERLLMDARLTTTVRTTDADRKRARRRRYASRQELPDLRSCEATLAAP